MGSRNQLYIQVRVTLMETFEFEWKRDDRSFHLVALDPNEHWIQKKSFTVPVSINECFVLYLPILLALAVYKKLFIFK